ncbi:DUF2087 domain-containing protein [Streptomyces sp. NPDC001380]|uniref:DUF2087 domain-containing protein n=1 Tax=Streptomyces sp. NPDC001380 TaxID=3364566 RepID=UPI0036860523
MTQSGHSARLVSALADPGRLRVLSRIVLAGDAGTTLDELSAAEPRASHAVDRLAAAGLVGRSPQGFLTARPDAFAEALRRREEPSDDRGPALRALFAPDGRLASVPVRRELRRALLEHLVDRMFDTGAVYSEGEVNIAIRQYWDDCAALRRYLVEGGLLVRSADGREYRVAA